MDKIEIVGTLSGVDEVSTSEKGSAQNILILTKRFDKDSGEELGTTTYPAVIFGDKIKSLNPMGLMGKRVTATCFLNSTLKEVNSKQNEGDKVSFYNLYLSCVDLQEYVKK